MNDARIYDLDDLQDRFEFREFFAAHRDDYRELALCIDLPERCGRFAADGRIDLGLHAYFSFSAFQHAKRKEPS